MQHTKTFKTVLHPADECQNSMNLDLVGVQLKQRFAHKQPATNTHNNNNTSPIKVP
jgi:hypothetical protein